MKKRILTAVLFSTLLVGPAIPGIAAVSHHHSSYRRRIRHKRHVNTARRVGIGAAGGAAIGALAGGGKGAGIGAIAGAGAGALYDAHQKHEGHN
jgi:hypothetical protein